MSLLFSGRYVRGWCADNRQVWIGQRVLPRGRLDGSLITGSKRKHFDFLSFSCFHYYRDGVGGGGCFHYYRDGVGGGMFPLL